MAEHPGRETHEQRQAAYQLEVRAKYTQAEVNALGVKGHAFGPDAEGDYSYPIDDLEDLRNAIHAVGRGNADHNDIRKFIMKMAGVLSATDEIPDNWGKDGSIDETKAIAGQMQCPRCSGDGTVDLGQGDITCPQCDGDGMVAEDDGPIEEESHTVPATAIRAEFRGTLETRIATGPQFELREVPNGTGGTNLRFTGFASVTGDDAAYEMEDWLGPWTESVNVGAFKKTLAEGADVAFLLNHQGMTLARTKPGTLKLSEETEANASPIYGVTGLHSEAMLDPTNMYVSAMRSAVERGDLDEMSFAFRVMRQEWNNDYDRRWINEVSLDKGDVSLVNYGANPTTGGTVAMRQKLGIRSGDIASLDRLVVMFKRSKLLGIQFDIREGKVLSSANASKLQEALEALHSTDDADIPGIVKQLQAIDAALDTGQAAISAVLSVADPDGDKNDLEPTLEAPTEAKSLGFMGLPDYTTSARARLEVARGSR